MLPTYSFCSWPRRIPRSMVLKATERSRTIRTNKLPDSAKAINECHQDLSWYNITAWIQTERIQIIHFVQNLYNCNLIIFSTTRNLSKSPGFNNGLLRRGHTTVSLQNHSFSSRSIDHRMNASTHLFPEGFIRQERDARNTPEDKSTAPEILSPPR